jgi:hypothetical protein
MVKPGENPECCDQGKRTIQWAQPDSFSGPEEKGWTIPLYGGGDVYRELVLFCPFCGIRLPEPE